MKVTTLPLKRYVHWAVLCCSLTSFLLLIPQIAYSQNLGDETRLFFPSNQKSILDDHKDFVNDGMVLELDQVLLRKILSQRAEFIEISIPINESEDAILQLYKSNIFAHDFRSFLSSEPECEIWFDHQVHYWGTVKHWKQSMVAISFSETGVAATISSVNEHFNLSNIEQTDQYLLFKESSVLIEKESNCEVENKLHHVGHDIITTTSRTSDNCVGMYIEIDHDLVLAKGSVMSAFDHLAAIFNQVSLLYSNEGIDIYLKELKIWDEEDPYTGSSTLSNLYSFRDRLSGQFNGDLAHLVGQKGSGGVAYIDVLCNSYYSVGYSDIKSGYQAVPVYSWAVEVMTHEIGHNLGSKHTHACAWNGNNTPIDGCGAEAGYSDGCDGPIPNKGTIMSYCHLLYHVGINFNLGFGPQPGNLIREKIANANCLSSCNANPCVLTGQACNDGDDCTLGETFDNECNCNGGVVYDVDNDGYCSGIDPDDNNPCVPDINQGDCEPFSGCDVFSQDDFEVDLGAWEDGGVDVHLGNYSQANSGNQCVRLRDNSGNKSSLISERLFLQGIQIVNISFSALPVSMESGENLLLEISFNNGEVYEQVDRWVSGQDFQNNQRLDLMLTISDKPFNNETRIRFRCDASSNSDMVYLDDIELEFCSDEAECLMTGMPCDDGDECTTGEQYDEYCICNNGVFVDTDEDGICDANDDCPSFNNALIGQTCNDGDGCTVNDIYHEDCNCYGQYYDLDEDGYCIGFDPDDNNPCVPDDQNPACHEGNETDCIVLDDEGFESSFGIWIDGGGDAARSSNFGNYTNYGTGCVRLRDNAGTSSSIYTEALTLSAYNTIDVSFSFYPVSMENGEDFFLEISNNNGDSFSKVASWTAGENFENLEHYTSKTSISNIDFSDEVILRIRCDASSNSDMVYIDEIKIEGCNVDQLIGESISEDQNSNPFNMEMYPNPANIDGQVNLFFNKEVSSINVRIFDILGKQVYHHSANNQNIDRLGVSLDGLFAGTYFIEVSSINHGKIVETLIVH